MASPESGKKIDRRLFPSEEQPTVLNLLREIVYDAIKNNQSGAVYLTNDNRPFFIELQTGLEYRDLACSGVLTPVIKLSVIPESYGPPLDYITYIFTIGGRSVFPTECFITPKALFTVISGNNGDDLIISRGRISRDDESGEVRIQGFRETGRRISQRAIDAYACAAESSGY